MSVTRAVLLLLSLTAVLVQGEQAELKTKPKPAVKPTAKPAAKPKVVPKSAPKPKAAPKKPVPMPDGFPWCQCNIRRLEASPWRLKFTGYEPLQNKTAACFSLEMDPDCPPTPCAHMSLDKVELVLKGTSRTYTPYAWVNREVAACGWGDAPEGASVLKVMNLGLTAKDVEEAGGKIPVCFSMGKYKSLSTMSGLSRDTVRYSVFGPENTQCCPTGVTAPLPKPPPSPPPSKPVKKVYHPPMYPDWPDAPRNAPRAPRPPKRVVVRSGKPPVPAVPLPPGQPAPPLQPVSPDAPCHPDPKSPVPEPCHPDEPASPIPPMPRQPDEPCDHPPPPFTPKADPGFPFCQCDRSADGMPWRITLGNSSATATGSKVALTVRVARGEKSKEKAVKLEFKIDPTHRQVIQNAKLNDKVVTPIWDNDRPVVKFTNLDLVPGKIYTLSFDLAGCTLAHMCGYADHCKYAIFNTVNQDGLCPVNDLQL